MKGRNQRKMIVYGLAIALLVTTVAYAVLQTTLNINGTVNRKGGSWNIHFENVANVVKSGKATITTPTISNAGANLTFSAELVVPKDSVSFTVDVVNDGTIDAKLNQVVLTGVSEAAANDVTYTATYADGTPIAVNDELKQNQTKTIKVTAVYNDVDSVSAEEVELDLGLTLIYVQAEGTGSGSTEVNPPYGPAEGDTSLASAPNLLNNSLTPVIYDGTNWVVADTTKAWYNYDNQQWANAVILKSGVTKDVGDIVHISATITEEEVQVGTETEFRPIAQTTGDIVAMYVWIPRYEYRIVGQYGTHTDGTAGTQETPGEIEVNFIPRTQTTASSGYILHPAFTWDLSDNDAIEASEHITGIWVGKFETSGNAEAPLVLPTVPALRYQNVSTQFATAQKFSNYLTTSTNVDSHMMKNSEWGAVAYLSQSRYGKYGNDDYSGTNKEIYQNKSSEYITGSSNGIPGSSTTNTIQCSYNDITDRGNGTGSCGGGASTTGNIYGVYDMSGGAYECVMGYLTTASSTWGASKYFNGAKFSEEPAGRYYDAYTSTSSSTACNGGICYGHALSETAGWYEDSASFVSTYGPWFPRSGDYYNGVSTGVFYSGSYNGGNVSLNHSFRSVFLAPGA